MRKTSVTETTPREAIADILRQSIDVKLRPHGLPWKAVADDLIAGLRTRGLQIAPIPPLPEKWWRLDARDRRINPAEPYEDAHEIISEAGSYELVGVRGPAGDKWGFMFEFGGADYREGHEVNWYPTKAEAERMLAEYLRSVEPTDGSTEGRA